MITAVAILLSVAVLFLAVKGVMSHYQPPEAGLVGGKLKACPDKPNCVGSEAGRDERHAIAPLDIKGDADAAWARLEASVEAMGGVVLQNSEGYLHAEFTTAVFRFVDDVEARLDREAGVIQLRSASRVGHSDFGANRKRVEAIRKRFGESR